MWGGGTMNPERIVFSPFPDRRRGTTTASIHNDRATESANDGSTGGWSIKGLICYVVPCTTGHDPFGLIVDGAE